MSVPPAPARSLLRFAGIGAFWTLVGLAFASQFYLSSTLLGRSVTATETLLVRAKRAFRDAYVRTEGDDA